jgi:hypothetical protein
MQRAGAQHLDDTLDRNLYCFLARAQDEIGPQGRLVRRIDTG